MSFFLNKTLFKFFGVGVIGSFALIASATLALADFDWKRFLQGWSFAMILWLIADSMTDNNFDAKRNVHRKDVRKR